MLLTRAERRTWLTPKDSPGTWYTRRDYRSRWTLRPFHRTVFTAHTWIALPYQQHPGVLARLYPIMQHSTASPSAARITSAGLLSCRLLFVTSENITFQRI